MLCCLNFVKNYIESKAYLMRLVSISDEACKMIIVGNFVASMVNVYFGLMSTFQG